MELILRSKVIAVHKLRLDAGEKAFETISEYCKDNNITAADINFIGACSWVRIFYYDPKTKEYEKFEINEPLEVLPCEGNIGVYEGKPIIHIHGSFGNSEFDPVYGGHIDELIVSATLEVTIAELGGPITRKYDERTCLKLMTVE